MRLDQLAAELYQLFAQTTKDPKLEAVFRQLQAEEIDHLAWWVGVQRRLDAGELIGAEPGPHVVSYMRAIVATLRAMVDASPANLTDDDRLSLAASLEFFTLDPIFAWLIQESDADGGEQRQSAYAGHVDLLISAMEERDSWPLAPHIALLRSAKDERVASRDSEHAAATGLPSQTVVERAIDDLCADVTRAGEPISLALIEVPLDRCTPGGAPNVMGRVASAVASLLRFTDLLATVGPSRFAVVFPSTGSATACAAAAVLADAASGIATEAGCGRVAAVSAVVTIAPGEDRCSAFAAFAAVEELLARVQAAGELQVALELD